MDKKLESKFKKVISDKEKELVRIDEEISKLENKKSQILEEIESLTDIAMKISENYKIIREVFE